MSQMTKEISVCRNLIPVLSTFMSYHGVCNTTATTSGAETVYHSRAHEWTLWL